MAKRTDPTVGHFVLALMVHVAIVSIFSVRGCEREVLSIKGGPAPVQAIAFTDPEQIKDWEKILRDPHFLRKEKQRAELEKKQARQKKDQERLREEKQKEQKELQKKIEANRRLKEKRRIDREKERESQMILKRQRAAKKKAEEAHKKQVAKQKAEAAKRRMEQQRKKAEAAAVKRKELNKIKRREAALAKQAKLEQQKEMEAERLGLKNAENTDYSDELSRYISDITATIAGNWTKPPNLPPDSECDISIQQTPTGLVISYRVTGGAGCGSRFMLSVNQAMERTTRLPRAPVKEVFDRVVIVKFKANDN